MGDCISWCNPVFKRVDELPPVEVATRNHTYITPDNKAYILNENGDGFIQFSSDVSMDMVEKAIRQIVAETELNLETANLTLEGRTLSWSGTLNDGRPFNSSITLPEDKDTLYDDTELKNRIQELENKPDNDTVYDDTELTNRVEALENKVDNDTKYTAGTGLTLTNNQFSADMNVLATKADTDDLGNRIYALEQEVDDDTIYDDTELRERIDELETKADYNTTYTIEVKDGVATLVGSNGTRNEIGKVTDNDTIYDDSELIQRLTAVENRTDENTRYALNLESIPSETANLRDLEFTTNSETGFGGVAFRTTGLPSMLAYKGAYTTSIRGLEFNTTITKPDRRTKSFTSKFPLEFTSNVESNYISRDFRFLGLHAICNLNLEGQPSNLSFGFFVDVYNYDMDTNKITSDPAITVPITKEVFLGQETASAVFPDGSEVVISFTGEPTITNYRLVYRLKEVTE